MYHLLDWSRLGGVQTPPRLYALDPAFTAQVVEQTSVPADSGAARGDGLGTQEDSAYTGAAATSQIRVVDRIGDGGGSAVKGDGCVVSLGSFSKILAPGLRLGWIEASPSLIRRIADRGYVVSGGSVAPFVSEVVAELLPELRPSGARPQGGETACATEAAAAGAAGGGACSAERPSSAALSGRADPLGSADLSGTEHGIGAHLDHLVRDYSTACDAMVRAVRAAAPDLTLVSEPRGGFFAWVLLPEGMSADALLPIAERHGVVFLPGRACAPSCPPEAFERHARLCFAMEEPAEIKEGVLRLAAAVREARGATV